MAFYRQDQIRRRRQRIFHSILGIIAIILAIAIIWVDLRTGFWGDTVILSALAAGLLLYFATVFIGNKVTHKSETDNWLPLTRLALTDILHNLTAYDLSESVDGTMVPRSLSLPISLDDTSIDKLSEEVVKERNEVTTAISKWASYLAANADVQELVLNVADTGSELDDIRLAINSWKAASPNDRTAAESRLNKEINEYNAVIARAVSSSQRILLEMRGDDEP